ncbi:MAG: ABC transporter permease [Candidatus Aminicenantes bacterium]|nr:ABC transporter permease [Candidatus Aminicenantes bacterium]
MDAKGKRLPRLTDWMIRKLTDREDCAAIIGDFEEEFHDDTAEHGTWRAYLRLWGLFFISLPSFLKNMFYWSGAMFKNYLTVALRTIKRHKGFSLINIIGLTVGMAAAVLTGIYLQHELSFDRHHAKADRIYRICIRLGEKDVHRGAFTVPPMAAAMKAELPEIEETVRMSLWPRNYLIKYEDNSYLEKGLIFADGSIFDVFSIPFLAGDPKTALTEPYTVVLSQKTAKKYFGSRDPVGETLHFADIYRDFKVTGVVEDCPATSHFHFEMIGSLCSSKTSRDTGWGGHTYFTYILLKEGASPEVLEAKFPDFVKRHWGVYISADTGISYEKLIKEDRYRYGYFLEPLTAIHLGKKAEIGDTLSIKGSRTSLMIFSTIAVFVLLIACINFMNLSTARFSHRSKEVGVRKVLGSNRKQLMFQFMGESLLISFLALGFSLVLTAILLPSFGRLAQRQLHPAVFLNPLAWTLFFVLAAVVGITAGSYPALFLSSFNPLRTIRGGRSGRTHRHDYLRRGLVLFQFAVTFAILFGTMVVASQLGFLRQKDLGFDKEHILVIHRANNLKNQKNAFKQELLRFPEISTIADTDTLPGRHYDDNGHRMEGRPASEERQIFTMYGDNRLKDLLGLSVVEGRFFSPDIASDKTSAVVINQTTAKDWGLEEPVGKRFRKEYGDAKPGEFVTIIGVVKDFHFQSLHQPILPMIIRPLSMQEWRYTSVKLQSGNLPATLEKIRAVWDKLSGGQPFTYSFLDEDFNSLYKQEQRTGSLFSIFALTAVSIACLGLFGLISFSTERRIKEIGIRKVLGAGVVRIVYLLSKEVVLLVAVGAAVASPLAYYFMHRWLQNFAFRISLHPLLFVVSGAVTLGIAFLTISYRAVKAGRTNPAEALKYE